MQKDKGMFDFGWSKELCMRRRREGESDFIFIHLPWALSSDTGKSFKPLILACPDSLPWALSAHPLLPAEWQRWAPVGPNQNLRAQQGPESLWVASLPLLALLSYFLP